ncbi:GAF domain-containing sensor histidine kinase [Polyangium jinanense]|uniref:histidine kinase n=1 Tax=Polyangium jinanense TaxID=2829994 RepID=A0A9X3X243_9BACT|nr:GAF domain-containing sensor histidine kinase [Polyangium jinanense]MDC3954829.1 GAF domain-containing sensor histidine kinase [Polyangium jinanense]MDC3981400.1 GAF domain-containing sensor histidine kinase [Polyangium jinanense]
MKSSIEPPDDPMRSPACFGDTRIPSELIQKWQGVVNLVADIVRVPASLIMKVEPPEIGVLVASESKGNPYEHGEKAALDTGLYCETVMSTKERLLVPNALVDEKWKCNPDIKLGMVSYLGFPITWPSGEVFGTICVLDTKENAYSELYERLLLQFRDVVEADLRVLCDFDARLAREARARIEGLQASERQLQEAVRLRDEFLSIASHELRTPIASLQLMVQALTRGVVSPTPEATLRAFGLAERQITRLTRLIEELLEVSRIQAGRLSFQFERLDLVALVREVVQRFEVESARVRSPLSFHSEQPVMGLWDRSKLEQVVTNILSNALKFGAGKPIEISVEEAPIGTGRIVVTDHGIGIPPECLPRIFERFERAVSAQAYGGLGLGLYIVRSIVEALGGTVRADSLLGSGSTFTVELPCNVGGPLP